MIPEPIYFGLARRHELHQTIQKPMKNHPQQPLPPPGLGRAATVLVIVSGAIIGDLKAQESGGMNITSLEITIRPTKAANPPGRPSIIPNP